MPSLHCGGNVWLCRDGTPVPSASTKGNVACSPAGCHTTPNPSYLRRGAVAASQPYLVGATGGCRDGTSVPSASTKGNVACSPAGCHTTPNPSYLRRGAVAASQPYLVGQRVAVGTAPLCRPPRGCRTGPKRNYTRSGRTAWECRPYIVDDGCQAPRVATLCGRRVAGMPSLP